jgi:16S rRNA (adenine1518-N6/adenine1519-N6)-dimethyltransferase
LKINYDSPSALRAFLKENNFGMQKKFGQNFLINFDARKRLIDELGPAPRDDVWEVGPGLGAMTILLLERGAAVRAFEIDRGFCRLLNEIFLLEKDFTLVEGDVLKTWKSCSGSGSGGAAPNISLLGNLPYNIGAKLLGDFAENNFFFKRIVVTVQKEVAQRIAAKAGSKNYSSLSVLLSYYYDITLLPVLKADLFFPSPNVDSQSVRLELKSFKDGFLKDSFLKESPCFASLVRAMFSSRRKTLKNNLSAYIKTHNGQRDAASILTECNIPAEIRAEQLAPDTFMRLAQSAALNYCTKPAASDILIP